jgi:hypothetical protein
MRVSKPELAIVALLIGYVAFFTHPPPKHLQDFLASPVGNIISLVGILFVAVYKSLIVGVFLAIAYVMTVNSVTEYLDEKEQAPAKKLTSNGVPNPAVSAALKDLLKPNASKGDTITPISTKRGGPPVPKPAATAQPKPKQPATHEHFASV